jgi:WhiB family redox-sensing transcriptional regulator
MNINDLLNEITQRGECRFDPELHTGPADTIESESDRAARIDVAREVCAGCPCRPDCLRYAMSLPDLNPDSVWGGLTGAEITILIAQSAYSLNSAQRAA